MFLFITFFIIITIVTMIPTAIIVQHVIEKIKSNVKEDFNTHKMPLCFEENYDLKISFIPDVKEVSNVRCKRKK